MENKTWTENVILADADYVDRVAFDLTVNFERMLGRRVPPADLARWLECVALDGGLRPGQHEVQAILVRDGQSGLLKNFVPADFQKEINGKAFRGELGEFALTVVQAEEMVTKDDLLLDTLSLVCQQPEVKRLMVVVPEQLLDTVRPVLRRTDREERRTTLLTMQPATGGAFRQELLGYSLMAALGISGQEIDERLGN